MQGRKRHDRRAEEMGNAAVSLVVVEPGSEWPTPVGDTPSLIAFSADTDRLFQRTQEMLDALRRSRRHVRVAVLACNGDMEGDEDGFRTLIARALLDAVSSQAFGHLVLNADGRASLRLRQELFRLTGALSERLGGTTATVSLRFIEEPRALVHT
jgi:hypothetical protein